MSGDDPLGPELEERLRRGLALLALQTPPRRTRSWWLPAAAAAAVVLAATGTGLGLALTGHDGHSAPQQAVPSPVVTSTPPISGGPPGLAHGITYDLPRLVEESPRVLIGRVTRVTHGDASDASGGLPYVLAEIVVDRTLRGPETPQVVAFDYEYGTAVVSDAPLGASFTEGERVLVFLSSADGTVHAQLAPRHWQVTGGASGKYRMSGDEVRAPFTLEQLERQLRS